MNQNEGDERTLVKNLSERGEGVVEKETLEQKTEVHEEDRFRNDDNFDERDEEVESENEEGEEEEDDVMLQYGGFIYDGKESEDLEDLVEEDEQICDEVGVVCDVDVVGSLVSSHTECKSSRYSSISEKLQFPQAERREIQLKYDGEDGESP